MSVTACSSFFRRHSRESLVAVLLALLLMKYFQSYFRFDVPLGYDVGLYRYLFLRYAEALPALHLPRLDPWAQEHPVGLFLFSTVLLKLGVPLDALTGWMWNLMPVVLVACLAWIAEKRFGKSTALALLIFGLLSQPLFDGFVAMYWKTFLSLLFTAFAYHHFEKRSPWFYPLAFFAVITHHQTGLIVVLAVATWWVFHARHGWKDPFWRTMTVISVLLGIAVVSVYLPNWQRSFWSPFKSIFLLRGDAAPSGSFPETMFYLRTMWISLLFGAYGFWKAVRSRLSLWEFSVAWCLIFIVFRLVFYKRFFLQLDFFLLPFAAFALTDLWRRFHSAVLRSCIIILLLIQAGISAEEIFIRSPVFSLSRLQEVRSLQAHLPKGASIVALEDQSGPWLLGWLPDHNVGAPGLFDFPGWTYAQWEKFLYGTNQDRKALLASLHGDVFFYLSSSFTQYYGDHVRSFLQDPCLKHIEDAPLLESTCSSSESTPSS